MKVFYITMQFPNPREAFACNEVKELHDLGSDVSVHSFRTSHPQLENLIAERQLSNIDLTFSSLTTLVKFPWYSIIYFRVFIYLFIKTIILHFQKPKHLLKTIILCPRILELYHLIKKVNPEVVHLYWSHYPAHLGILLKKFQPQILVTMSLAAYDLRMNYSASAYLTKKADAVITHCKANIPAIQKYGGDDIKVIYRGVPDRLFKSELPQKIPYSIATAGALIKAKGMEEVILVFCKVKKDYPLSTLTIYGDGNQRKHLEKLVVSENLEGVTFKGHISNEQLNSELTKHQIFLYMSHEDRLPNVVKEAVVNYCYPVVSRTIGMDELVIDGKTGTIVPIKSISGAYSAIQNAFEKPNERNRAISAGYKHLRNNFSLREEMTAYQDIWKKLINQ